MNDIIHKIEYTSIKRGVKGITNALLLDLLLLLIHPKSLLLRSARNPEACPTCGLCRAGCAGCAAVAVLEGTRTGRRCDK